MSLGLSTLEAKEVRRTQGQRRAELEEEEWPAVSEPGGGSGGTQIRNSV